ncbi:fructosamine kinase family protein [Nocardia blacklockiae]|uniref:fructosamine kinase family protein n=1 Tax=Nocardia blacklockiae TaxID=480036 RepID=UPI001894D7AB|nr:fructosamine kinase family protein [Nocardia blacklockiae]MBF6170607.1 fructosamine kinase family protein [Nocardia blacklockiae]
MSDAATRVHELLGVPVSTLSDLGHRHAWTLHRARLADGREVFVKAVATDGNSDIGGAVRAEAAGLRWLGECAAAPVPPVLGEDDRTLILPWLETTTPSAQAAEEFGRALAAMHASGPDTFGAPWNGFIATVPQDNTPTAGEWGRWYAERRLAPLLPAAAPVLGPDGVRLLDRVIAEIDSLAGDPEPPSHIHGDLWSGNLLWTAHGVRLIDPAAHGGHRETDLAMLALFGAPHLDRILAAYQAAAPLKPGWRQRIPLHQLYPLLVHVVLFGDSYRGMTLDAAEATLRG